MSRMKAPEGATSCSHDEQTFEVDASGFVEVPEIAVVDLMSHGFVPAPESRSQEDLDKELAENEEAARLEAEQAKKLENASDLKKGKGR